MNTSPTKLLAYAGTLFLSILSILAIVILPSLRPSSSQRAMITVSGSAEVKATPDIASFNFSVSEVSDTPEKAQEVISEKITKILDGLEELGMSSKDIETESYSINPKYEWSTDARGQQTSLDGKIYFPGGNQQVLVGYDVRQQVNITLRDLNQVPEVLTLLASSKVENLYGPNFEIENPEKLQEEAREKAITEAQTKAKQLARDLDVKLSDLASFSEDNGGYYPMPYLAKTMMNDMAQEASFEPQLPEGETEITSTVSISYYVR